MAELTSNESEPERVRRKTGRYANVFRVGFNAFEMVVEFGEQFSDSEHVHMHTRIVTNPVFARGLADSLNDALSRCSTTQPSERVEEN